MLLSNMIMFKCLFLYCSWNSEARMAKIDRKKQSQTSVIQHIFLKYLNINFAKYLLFDQEALPLVGALILLGELLLNVVVINKVPYTEIDWVAYMQECEGFLNGTTNYALLKGDTGPLVYPAGFVYIYSALYYATSRGNNILLAQYIFALIYLIQIYLVIRLYAKSRKLPPYVLILSIFTSYRIHSIYVLRLFNDPIAVLFVYLAISLFFEQRWSLGSICFSLGVSVKMNILLFAPAVLIFYITNLGYFKAFKQLTICALVQLILGAPFLLTYPKEYIRGSFDLGRVFEHKWTVNYRFLSRSIFEEKIFHLSLLAIHLLLVAIFSVPMFMYFKNYCRLRELQRQLEPQIKKQNIELKKSKNKKVLSKHTSEELSEEQKVFLESFERSLKKSANYNESIEEDTKSREEFSIQFDRCIQLALLPLFTCNLLGIICARSLHYQFYVWYFHSLPYLVWCTNYNMGLRFLILGLIEYCWNTYPSTVLSSALLHMCHLILLFGIGQNMFLTKSQSEKLSKLQ